MNSNERSLWIAIVILVGIVAFVGGSYWASNRAMSQTIAFIQEDIYYLTDRVDDRVDDISQVRSEISRIRDIILDLEEWVEQDQRDQSKLLKEYISTELRDDNSIHQRRFSGVWDRLRKIEQYILTMAQHHPNCTECQDIVTELSRRYIDGP